MYNAAVNYLKGINILEAEGTGAQTGIAPNPSKIEIPKGYEFVRQVILRSKDGTKIKHLLKNLSTGKFQTLEDMNVAKPKISTVNLNNYKGEKLTGREPGFDEWALKRIPENDHFPDLSHGLDNPKELMGIINREFEALPNGARIDLGETFSGDISANLLQYAYRHKDRIKTILPLNPEETTKSNSFGIKGAEAMSNFNKQLERLLDIHNYSPTSVKPASYNYQENYLVEPKLSFIKLHKYGGKY